MLTDLTPPIIESAELTQWHLWLINYSEVQYLGIGEMGMYLCCEIATKSKCWYTNAVKIN